MVSKSLSKDINGYMQKTTINKIKEECVKYRTLLVEKLRKEKGL